MVTIFHIKFETNTASISSLAGNGSGAIQITWVFGLRFSSTFIPKNIACKTIIVVNVHNGLIHLKSAFNGQLGFCDIGSNSASLLKTAS